MKEAEYATTKGDKVHRILSLLVLLAILGISISEGAFPVWYRFTAAPVFATAMIWFADLFASCSPRPKTARNIRIVGWAALTVIAVFVIFL